MVLAPTPDSLFGLAVADANNAYFADESGGAVVQIALAGGTPTTLASGDVPLSVAVDATTVYWTAEDVVDGGSSARGGAWSCRSPSAAARSRPSRLPPYEHSDASP